MDYLPRALEPVLRARLETFPVVIVTGARQTGKSTLSRRLGGDERTYLTLDDLEVLDQARNAPAQLVTRAPRMTLDEVQRVPRLLLAIKRAVDEDRRPGRFLLTGSANLELMESVSETLAGRAVYVTLWPMTRRETAGLGSVGRWDVLLDNGPQEWPKMVEGAGPPEKSWQDLARRGGYPDPTLRLESTEDRAAWFEGYQRTYLERDLQQLSAIDNLVGFQRLMRAAALRVGNLVNQADIARDVGLPPSTAQRYLALLETSYQLLKVEPYSVNRTKRLVKSPRVYGSDTGLALHLSAEEEPRGAHLENLIAGDLFAWRETRTRRPNVLFWRTSKGAEVDFVIEAPGALIPIEVKTSTRVRDADTRHLRTFMDEYPERVRGAVLLYGGDEIYWVADRILAVPWYAMI